MRYAHFSVGKFVDVGKYACVKVLTNTMCALLYYISLLSSPRALRALGLLLAHSGTGRDFLARNGPDRTKTAVTQKRSDRDGRVQRQNGANAEGYKRSVDKKRGPISKNGFSGRNPEFLARKKMFTFGF